MTSAQPLEIAAKEELPVVLVAQGEETLAAKLCRLLLRKKIRVFYLNKSLKGKKTKIDELLNEENFSILNDLKSESFLGELDYVILFAGFEEFEGETLNLLEVARQAKAKFLLISSLTHLLNSSLFAENVADLEGDRVSPSLRETAKSQESLTADYQKKFKLNCRILRLGDIYGPGISLESPNIVSELIECAQTEAAISIDDDGDKTVYPTFVTDGLEAIARAIFRGHTAGRIYNLAGEEIGAFEFAKKLAKIAGNKLILPSNQNRNEGFFKLDDLKKNRIELGWEPKVTLEEGLKQTLDYYRSKKERTRENTADKSETKQKEQVVRERKIPLLGQVFQKLRRTTIAESKPPAEKKIFPQRKEAKINLSLPRITISLLLILLVFFFPFLSIAWDIFWGAQDLTFLEKGLPALPPKTIEVKGESVEEHFQSARGKVEDLSWIFVILKQSPKQNEWKELLIAGEKIGAGTKEIGQTMQIMEKIGENIFSGQPSRQDIQNGKIHLQSAYNLWGEASAVLKKVKIENQPMAAKLSYYRQALKKGAEWLGILPGIIAPDSQRTYLVLFQNNMEMRPTGGFVGSFGLLTFEKGRLTNLKVEDVYTVDGQLRGHVEPPEAIKKYLSKEHWFLRDANWNPNFPDSALKMEWFLDKELGIKTDGVIALDLNLAKNLLEVLGPLKVFDYQETLSSQNLFEETERHAEEDFFPGSTGKKDFLGSLAKTLMDKIKASDNNRYAQIQAVEKALKEGHFLIYFNDPQLEESVTQNRWGGEIQQTPCESVPNCLGDYQMAVEANVGVNKANHWVKKEAIDQISFKSGQLGHKLKINYQNSSPQNSLLGGAYKNYLRIYVPSGAVLTDLTVDGETVGSPDITQESQKTVFGFYLEIPPQEKRQIEISYFLPSLISSGTTSYRFFLQKQPGLQEEPITTVISYPINWSLRQSSSLTPDELLGYNPQLYRQKSESFNLIPSDSSAQKIIQRKGILGSDQEFRFDILKN